jgi:hypothetical protein
MRTALRERLALAPAASPASAAMRPATTLLARATIR